MIAKSYLVPGDALESKNEEDKKNGGCTFSFSHTTMFKGSYPLILKQILELSELENDIKPDQIDDSTNQIVVWIRNNFSNDNGKTINQIGTEILSRIVERYKKIIADQKYKDLFQKFSENKEQISKTLSSVILNFSRDALIELGGKIFDAGERVYDGLKDIFVEKDYLWLKYLAMDVFCYPVVSDFNDKINFLNKVRVSSSNLCELRKLRGFGLTFSEIGTASEFDPPCFMSVTNIALNNQLIDRAPNNFTWEESSLMWHLSNFDRSNCNDKDSSQILE